jgi:hypothetical protein
MFQTCVYLITIIESAGFILSAVHSGTVSGIDLPDNGSGFLISKP